MRLGEVYTADQIYEFTDGVTQAIRDAKKSGASPKEIDKMCGAPVLLKVIEETPYGNMEKYYVGSLFVTGRDSERVSLFAHPGVSWTGREWEITVSGLIKDRVVQEISLILD